MILSSADIVRVLGADAIIRQEARLSVVDGRPGLDTGDYVYIYIDKYPTVEEFEATWKIWVTDASGMGKYVLDAMTVLLPSFDFNGSHYTTTDFASERTVVKTEAEKQLEQLAAERQEIKDDFSDLQKGLQDRLNSVRDGVDGLDGKDGRDGRDGIDGKDGRDGKDIDATETELFDLKDVDQSLVPLESGQVLTWDGTKWTNLYVRQVSAISGGGGGGSSTLGGLSDVSVDGVTDGQFIQYDSASSEWQAVTVSPGSGATELDQLTDVTIDPALLEKDFGLVYDGGEWVVGSPPVLIEGHNQSGATISKGTPVYVAGTHNSGKPLLAPADADGAGTYPAIGLVHEDLANGDDGHVMLSGILSKVDTSAYSAGDALYLSTTAGTLTNVRPTAAAEKVQKVGLVTRVHATAGSVLIIGAGRTNDINNELVALIGAGDRNAVDLGTFSGSTISDNTDIKTALGELEAVADTAVQPLDNVSSLTNDAGYITSADIPADAVASVAGKTGVVTLVKADITDFSDSDYATAAQGATADTALQPNDNVSQLNNDAGYITSAQAPVQPGDLFSGSYNDLTDKPDIIPEAPQDGNYYVRQNGAWVNLATAIANLTIDGGVIT